MRCIKEIILDEGMEPDIFDARYKNEIPGTGYDIYVSSGGPGSPYDGLGLDWERKYFNLLDYIIDNNQKMKEKSMFSSSAIPFRLWQGISICQSYRKT